MRTYFRKLNENNINNDIIDKYLIDIFEIMVSNLAKDMNKINPKLKIFFNPDYKSPILKELKKEGIDINHMNYQEYTSYVINYVINYRNPDLKSFQKTIYNTVTECVDKYINEICGDDELSKDYIYKNKYTKILRYVYIYILNKEQDTNYYCRSVLMAEGDNYAIYGGITHRFFYVVKDEDNKFGVKNNDPVSKEHAIEYIKSNLGLKRGKPLKGVYSMDLYSGYFENI